MLIVVKSLPADFTRKPHVDTARCTLGTSARSEVSSVMSPSAVALKELLSQTPLSLFIPTILFPEPVRIMLAKERGSILLGLYS